MDADEEVLPLGAVLSQLPVDLPMGKLLVLSTLFNLEDELMTMAAVPCPPRTVCVLSVAVFCSCADVLAFACRGCAFRKRR